MTITTLPQITIVSDSIQTHAHLSKTRSLTFSPKMPFPRCCSPGLVLLHYFHCLHRFERVNSQLATRHHCINSRMGYIFFCQFFFFGSNSKTLIKSSFIHHQNKESMAYRTDGDRNLGSPLGRGRERRKVFEGQVIKFQIPKQHQQLTIEHVQHNINKSIKISMLTPYQKDCFTPSIGSSVVMGVVFSTFDAALSWDSE